MLVYNYPRAAGKTTIIVKHAIDRNLDVMVFGPEEKRRLYKAFPDLKPGQVFTVEEARSRNRKGYKYAGTVVDNLDLILQQLADNRVSAVSLTEPMVMMQHTRGQEDGR